ncbi:MAG: hypothetical protein FJ144_15035 [Deltaproteobacteria bacterium]|nr:hypothetical protein [Deltaproteobacteria bacterium]
MSSGRTRTKPCWKQLGSPANPKGFKYSDRERSPDGLDSVQVLAGEAGKAKASVGGKGAALEASGTFATLPLPLPVVAQLQTTGACWEASYATAGANDDFTFKAK